MWSLIFRLLAPFAVNLHIAWLPLLPSWSGCLRATDILSPKLRVLDMSHQNSSSFMLWLYCLVNKGKVWIEWKWEAWLKEGLSLVGGQWIWSGLSSHDQQWNWWKPQILTWNIQMMLGHDGVFWCLPLVELMEYSVSACNVQLSHFTGKNFV